MFSVTMAMPFIGNFTSGPNAEVDSTE